MERWPVGWAVIVVVILLAPVVLLIVRSPEHLPSLATVYTTIIGLVLVVVAGRFPSGP